MATSGKSDPTPSASGSQTAHPPSQAESTVTPQAKQPPTSSSHAAQAEPSVAPASSSKRRRKTTTAPREILTGGITWSIQCEGLIEYGLTSDVRSAGDIFDLWEGKTKVRVAWSTGGDGDTLYYGDAYVTSYEETAGLNEVASFSATFEGDGLVTKKVVDTANLTFNNNDD